MSLLGDPLRLGDREARNRLFFGPHETNLGWERRFSERHLAYYLARARGGAGLIVTEEASVHESDWPYERSPLSSSCGPGWAEIARACQEEGALVVAALGHSGGQGSSAYHQRAMWAPSPLPDVATREVGKAMEEEEIAELLEAFATAAREAIGAGCDGVEVNAGQWSLLRQFLSPLTNTRQDGYGSDRARLLTEVLEAVRRASGGGIVGLRASCDELAPWAGLVPEQAAELLAGLASRGLLDYVTVVRGSAYGTGATRPTGHVPSGFNRATAHLVRSRLPAEVAVVAQGSIVDPSEAKTLLSTGEADAVEMTRAQIADPAFGAATAAGRRPRPCVLCNQRCQVRDVRNPVVSCVVEPSSGYESEPAGAAPGAPGRVLVVGGGPAGLECALQLAQAGVPVRLLERADRFGGMALRTALLPGRERFGLFVDWLVAECRSAGAELVSGHAANFEELDTHAGPVVVCTGSRPGRPAYQLEPGALVDDVAEAIVEAPAGRLVIWDPIGGPIGAGAAELLAARGLDVSLVTPDFVAAEHLARAGDLASANVRLARAGVRVFKTTLVSSVAEDRVVLRHRFSGHVETIEEAVLIDAGHRLPEDELVRRLSERRNVVTAGDCVAPRSLYEAVLEGRRAAARVMALAPAGLAR